jgi:hypothetical protein
MANRKSVLAALWDGDLVGAAGALVAGILHMAAMLVFLLLLTAVSPFLFAAMPFIVYKMEGDAVQMLALVYFILGAFPAGMFTFAVYFFLTRNEVRGGWRKTLGWPTASLFCSWTTSIAYVILFNSLLFSDSNMAHAVFFALAPFAVFSPLWVYLIHRKRQKDAGERARLEWQRCSAAWEAARQEEEALWQKMQDDDRREKDAAWLRSQGIVS